MFHLSQWAANLAIHPLFNFLHIVFLTLQISQDSITHGEIHPLFDFRCDIYPNEALDFPRCSIGNISGDVGLVSAGRINKDTPPLTTPGHTSKSSAMDISSYIFEIEIHEANHKHFHEWFDPRLV